MGEALRAETIMGFAEALNYGIGWRFRRALHHTIDWTGTKGIHRDPAEKYGYEEILTWWRCSLRAEHAVVWITYQAPTSDDAKVGAKLSLLGGTPLDPVDPATGEAFEWKHNNGTLMAAQARAGIDTSGAAPTLRYRYRILSAWTGIVPVHNPSSPTRPRPLNIPSSARGSWLKLALNPEDVRIHSVNIWELYQERINQ